MTLENRSRFWTGQCEMPDVRHLSEEDEQAVGSSVVDGAVRGRVHQASGQCRLPGGALRSGSRSTVVLNPVDATLSF